MPEWLELELAHRLAPADAPEELWDRIRHGRAPRPASRPVWPIAAIVTVMVALGALWMAAKGEPSLDLEHLAQLQLRSTQPLDVQSGDRNNLKTWAQQTAGIDLNVVPSPQVQLLGTRLVRHGNERIVALSYRVDGRPAALLMAQASVKGNTPHPGIAMAGFDAACAICHSL